MDRFSYFNIFETKGIEYLAIIAFFLVLIPFWVFLNKPRRIVRQIRKGLDYLSASLRRIPHGVYHCKNHTWAHLEKSGTAKVGLDDLLVHMTGEVSLKKLVHPGDHIRKGDLMAELDQNGKVLQVFSPLSGEILGQNEELAETPELLNEDPYGQGWIYRIKPSDWIEETVNCYMGEKAVKWSTVEVERFKDFLASSGEKYSPSQSQVILQDGGELFSNALADMPAEAWQDFQNDFLPNP